MLNWSAEPINKRKISPPRDKLLLHEPARTHKHERRVEDFNLESPGRERQTTPIDSVPDNHDESIAIDFEKEFAALHHEKLLVSILQSSTSYTITFYTYL